MVAGLAELLQELRKHGLSLAFCSLQVRGVQPRTAPSRVLLPLPAPGIGSAPQGRLCPDGLSPAAFPTRSALAAGDAAASLLGAPSSQRGGRLQHLSPAVGCRAVGKGCILCPGLAGRLTAPGRWEVASSGLPQPKFLCPQDPVLQVLLSADLEGFQHFPSQEEAGEALGCPGCFPGAGVPRLLLRGALEDEPGSLTFVRPQRCRAGV